MLQALPVELQVRSLSYLRAGDLSAVHQVNRSFWRNRALQHAIVVYCATTVYPPRWTEGFEHQPVSTAVVVPIVQTKPHRKARTSSLGSVEDEDSNSIRSSKSRSSSLGSLEDTKPPARSSDSSRGTSRTTCWYTFEHLRNMELLVVARVLNTPEPTTGFVVSKSWCKAALNWLEGQQHPSDSCEKKKKPKKKGKRKQGKAAQKSPPPPPNINSDITCEHDQLQHLSSSKSVRARRRLLDKQAWKILMALYPESTALPAGKGECLQCRLELAQAKKATHDRQEASKQLRKEPLKDPVIRRFYTRSRGVPEHCVRTSAATDPPGLCPLQDGTYVVLPRAWCHGWRRFVKNGEGGLTATSYAAPDSGSLLCHLHRLVLLPPHLEAYLYGESEHLFESVLAPPPATETAAAALPPPAPVVAAAPEQDSIEMLRGIGLSEADIAQQIQAMRSLETNHLRPRPRRRPQRVVEQQQPAETRNELLDRENHIVVEIVTAAEFRALDRGPGSFGLQFTVHGGGNVQFGTQFCRACDATGRQCSLSIRNRSRNHKRGVPRSAGSLEY